MFNSEDAEIEKGQSDFINHMLTHTVRLVMVDDGLNPKGVASGFVAQRGEKNILISAGHCFRKNGPWLLETGIIRNEKALNFTVPQVQLLSQFSVEDPNDKTFLDVAWVELDFAKLFNQLKQDGVNNLEEIVIPQYMGPLSKKPRNREPYGFATYSQVELDGNLRVLHREAVYEIGMKYICEDENSSLYTFRLFRGHQGHDYYQGSSGSPIVDSEGHIVSIVAKGCKSKNEIYGFPLYRIVPLLDAGL